MNAETQQFVFLLQSCQPVPDCPFRRNAGGERRAWPATQGIRADQPSDIPAGVMASFNIKGIWRGRLKLELEDADDDAVLVGEAELLDWLAVHKRAIHAPEVDDQYRLPR